MVPAALRNTWADEIERWLGAGGDLSPGDVQLVEGSYQDLDFERPVTITSVRSGVLCVQDRLDVERPGACSENRGPPFGGNNGNRVRILACLQIMCLSLPVRAWAR